MSGFAICLELQLAGGTRYYSNTALHETAAYWEPRILEIGEPTLSTDPEGGYPSVPTATLTLDNGDGELSDLLNEDFLEGALGTIYEKILEGKTVTSTETRFVGKVKITGGDQTTLEIELQPAVITELDAFQRKLDTACFPNLPDGSVAGKPSTAGLGMNAVAGYATSAQGCVLLQMIDGTTNAEKFAVSMGGVYDITAVRRRRFDTNGVETWLTLTLTTHYTKFIYAIDAQGNVYSYIQLVSGIWQAGDEYYADIKGLPKTAYVLGDGANDYLQCAASGSTLPGHVELDEFTIQHMFYVVAGSGRRTIWAEWDSATAQYSILMDTTDLAVRSGGGNWLIDTPAAPTWSNGVIYTMRMCFKADEIYEVWIYNHTTGTAARYTSTSGLPSSVTVSTAAATWMAFSNLLYKANIRHYHSIFAGTCCVPVSTDTFTGDDSDPIEDIISEYLFCGIAQVAGAGTYYVRDCVGANHLTATSLTNSNITLVDYEKTPARVFDKWLRYKWFNWQIASAKIDRASFAAVAALQEALDWDDSGGQWFAGCVPASPGEVLSTEEALRLMCWCQGANITIGRDGRLRLVDCDIETEADPAAAEYRESRGDFVKVDLLALLRIWNQAPAVNYLRLHRDGGMWGGAQKAINEESIGAYGLAEEDAEFVLCGHSSYAAALIRRQMIRRSGGSQVIQAKMCGADAHALEVGDKVFVSAGNIREGQIWIYDSKSGLMTLEPELTGIEVGKQTGSVAIETLSEITVEINPTLDTGVSETYPNNSYGTNSFIQLDNWDYLCLRLALKYAIPAGIITLISAKFKLYCNSVVLESASPDSLFLRQCLVTTWGNNSTWNHFADNGVGAAWTDAGCIGGTNLAPGVSPNGTGWKNFTLNSTGRAYVFAQAGGSAYFTLRGPENYDWHSFASSDHGTAAWWPVLELVYLA